MGFFKQLQHAWNAFFGNDPKNVDYWGGPPRTIDISPTYLGSSYNYDPSRVILSRRTEYSIVNAIYNRIAIDCSSIDIKHVRVDDNDKYVSTIDSDLNNCLTLEANKDQAHRQFIIDVVESLFDEGNIAIVPIDTTIDPSKSSSYDIQTMRTGQILQWYPDYVKVRVYNDRNGQREDITLPKNMIAIIENPLYAIMNEPNSTLQRLIRKLNLLDIADEQSSSGKLNLIVQLPYIIKTEARKEQAQQRRTDIEDQLANSKYGIAYTDGTEHITQLNRSIDSNLNSEIDSLIKLLYSQLGITDSILNGTADEKTMLNYTNRTIEPVLNSIVDEMKRKFLTKTARSQRQTIMYFNNPFKLVPLANLADIGDKFTRNAIMSSNEMRQIIGLKPVNDPDADALRNKNLNKDENDATVNASTETDENVNDQGDPNTSSNEKIAGDTSLSDLVPKD